MTIKELFEKKDQLNAELKDLKLKINICIDFLYGNNNWEFNVFDDFDSFLNLYKIYTSKDDISIMNVMNKTLQERQVAWDNYDHVVWQCLDNENIILTANIEIIYLT